MPDDETWLISGRSDLMDTTSSGRLDSWRFGSSEAQIIRGLRGNIVAPKFSPQRDRYWIITNQGDFAQITWPSLDDQKALFDLDKWRGFVEHRAWGALFAISPTEDHAAVLARHDQVAIIDLADGSEIPTAEGKRRDSNDCVFSPG